MTSFDGFWSYVHFDDDADQGRITQLARDVAAQFEMLTAESLNLFLDRDNLVWGDDWRPKIDDSLSSIAFFIPIVTPRYFKSIECRRELNFFARNAQRLGVGELVLPILYVDFPALHNDPSDDDLIDLVKRFQWTDWTDLKFHDRSSAEYRRAVESLARQLVTANESAENTAASFALSSEFAGQEYTDEPGMLDKLGDMEAAFPKLIETLKGVSSTIEDVGSLMTKATADIALGSTSGRPVAARLNVARKLAIALSEPSEMIRHQGNQFATELHDIDSGVRVLIERAPDEIDENPAAEEQFSDLFESIREMVPQAEAGLGKIQGMIDQIAPLEKMSRDLRLPLRVMRQGLTLFVDGLSVMRGWISLMNEQPNQLVNK